MGVQQIKKVVVTRFEEDDRQPVLRTLFWLRSHGISYRNVESACGRRPCTLLSVFQDSRCNYDK